MSRTGNRSGLRKIILGGLVSVGLLFAVGRYANLSQAAQRFDDFYWIYLPFILLSVLIYYILKGLRWQLFLRMVGIRIPWHTSLLVYLAGQWFAFSPAGEFVKAYLLGRYGVPFAQASATVVMQVVIDFLSLAILGSITLLWYPTFWYVVLPFTASLLLAIGLLGQDGIWRKMSSWRPAARVYGVVGHSWQTLFRSTRLLSHIRPLLLGLILGVPTILIGSTALLLVAEGYLLPVNVVQSTFVYSLSQLLGAFSMLPHGLGAVEGSALALFNHVGFRGSADVIVVIALFRLSTLLWGVLIGGIALLALPFLQVPRMTAWPKEESQVAWK